MIVRAVLALAAALLLTGAGDPRPREAQGAALPMAPSRTITIDAKTATWLALDLSPDGRWLVFDLLGDLYRLPAQGGRAEQLTRGLAYDTTPVFSPDGKRIAFVSDRSGSDNLWIAAPDGRGAGQITFGDDDTVLVQPSWSADGRALYASRFRADLNNYELWRYGLDGGAELVAPVRKSADQPRDTWQSTLGVSPSSDGRWLYMARRVGGLDFDEIDAWTIVRRNLASGAEETVVAGSGTRGAERESMFAPVISHHGRRLAYATRLNGVTTLRLRDLVTGVDRELARIDPDLLQASTWQGIVPRYAFTPDDVAIVIARGGVPWRIPLAGNPQPLPFSAHMRVDVGAPTRVTIREADAAEVTARLIQAPAVSPDGEQIAFSALGAIWEQPYAAGATPRRIATADAASQPAWSADGRSLAFVTWSETAGGQVWIAPADGSAAPRAVSTTSAFYTDPVFTPAGDALLVVRSSAAARQATSFEYGKLRDAELVAMPLDGGAVRVVARGRLGGRPQLLAGGREAAVLSPEGLTAVDLGSGARRVIAQVTGPGWYFQDGPAAADDIRLSPDGKSLIAQAVEQLYLLPAPAAGATVDLTDPASGAWRLTTEGADFFDFGPNGTVDWSVGAQMTRQPLAGGAPKRQIAVRVSVPRPGSDETLVLRGGRVLTMVGGDRVTDDADVVITGRRIVAVGARGSVPIPPGATIRDVTGKTILPGFVDEHDHIGEARREVIALSNWGLQARLAFGVTTSFDPSTLSIDALAYQDLLDAGLILGPRLRSTGPALFSMERFRSVDDARRVLRRYHDAYGLANIKEYRTGNRRVRQWVAMAARELGLQPTTEGALSLKLDLTQILDGFASNEHALPAVPLGDDVIAVLKAQHTGYSATLSITNSGYPAADWLSSQTDPTADAKLRRFWPPAAIEQKLGAREWHPLAEQHFPLVAAEMARVQAAGGLVGMGSHGEVPGIGFHQEMQAHVMGGMAPMAVLHAATAGSAEVIGRLDDLGTVAAGKLADLVILDADPLADIRNTLRIDAVMRDGVLYDGATLAERWPTAGGPPAPPVAWVAGYLPAAVPGLPH